MLKSLNLVIVLGVIGSAIAVYAFLSPDSGVAGTLGALLALRSAIAVTVGSFVAAFKNLGRGPFILLAFLIGSGAILTAVAGFFLMQYGLAIVMALVFISLLVATFRHTPQQRLA